MTRVPRLVPGLVDAAGSTLLEWNEKKRVEAGSTKDAEVSDCLVPGQRTFLPEAGLEILVVDAIPTWVVRVGTLSSFTGGTVEAGGAVELPEASD